VLRAAGETETMQENIKDWRELDERDLGSQLLTEQEIAVVIFYYLFSSALLFFLSFLCLLGLPFASLIQIIA
jgi:hypothetical protein